MGGTLICLPHIPHESGIAGNYYVIWAIQVITFWNAQITHQCDVCKESVDEVDSTACPTWSLFIVKSLENSQSAASIIWFVVIPAEAAAVAEALLAE